MAAKQRRAVEPPPDDVARAIFYMHQEYELPIEATLLPVLIYR